MGLQNTAHYLKSKGRNGDTQLVHMSPGEVQGLQALAKAQGTSLTINPTTGLPEAFNFRWENLIPMAAGAALTATGVGAPVAALMVGGAYGAATGSIEKGLMAGIGAYGGAGIAEGLAEAGASSLVQKSGEVGATGAGATGAVATGTAAPVGDVFAGYSPTGSAAGTAGTTVGTTGSGAASAAQNAINAQAMPNLSADQISSLRADVLRAENPIDVVRSANMGNVAQSSQIVNPSMGQSFSNMGTGISNLGTQQGLASAYGAMPTGTLPATGISLLTAAQPGPSSVPGYQEDEYDRRLKGYRISPNYQPYQAPTPNPYYRPVYAAEGGAMESFDDEAGKDMAHGGIASLGGYSDGGRMLRGPGDGMSDSIPGIIGGKQPARLADGEFVVPADVVSHLGNGSTEAGAKKLYGMMDKIREARTGKKKQAPEIKADRYLPIKKMASGGITGYAEGGDIAGLYQSILGRAPDPEGLASWQKAQEAGTSFADIKKAFENSPEARANTVKKIYNEQLGREAEAEGLANWAKLLGSGKTAAEISKDIARSKEGQKMDIQSAASAYRQVLGRNPEPEGLQFWLSLAQSEGLSSKQLMDRIAEAAAPEMKARNITKPFTEMQLASLESDPFAGYYSDYDIYNVAPDAENVSMIDGRRVQFTTPVTRQSVVSQYKDGVYTSTPGKDLLNMPHVQAAINVARANGTLDQADYNTLTTGLNTAKTPAEVRAILNRPQGQVVIDAIQGQQIGEAKTLAAAQAEAAQRQPILTAQMAQNPGTYLSNAALTNAYRAAGVSIPADYSFYQGVDTRDRTANLLTPENLVQKRTELVNQLNRNNPYRVAYQPINRGIANLPASVQDPYSDAGLAFLYGNMMNQYAPAPLGQVNPATFTSNPFTYIPPPPNNLVLSRPIADAATPPPAPASGGTLGGAVAALSGDGG